MHVGDIMTLNVGVIGVGGIAQGHLRNITKSPIADLVAVCDVVEEKAEVAAESFDARMYTEYDQMIEKEDLEAVYICVPPHAHGEIEMKAIENDLALFIEKPLSSDPEIPEKISKAITERGLISSVGYNWRYSDMTQRALDLLEGQIIGLVVGYWMGGCPGVAWWRVKSKSGGQIVEQTTHIFDMARCLSGEVKRVYASAGLQVMQDHVEGLDVDDASVVNLEFANGAPGVVISTCMLSHGYRAMLSAFTKDLALEHTQGSLRVTRPGEEVTYKSSNDPYFKEDQVFLQAVDSGDPSEILSPYDDALKTHRVTMAANRCIETGKPQEI